MKGRCNYVYWLYLGSSVRSSINCGICTIKEESIKDSFFFREIYKRLYEVESGARGLGSTRGTGPSNRQADNDVSSAATSIIFTERRKV